MTKIKHGMLLSLLTNDKRYFLVIKDGRYSFTEEYDCHLLALRDSFQLSEFWSEAMLLSNFKIVSECDD